ncbi:MAG: hypothetical protein HY880_05190 [Deltaproteobacteria bacterium]|nr:hypothetical protein [Deltaproteobacteria bacterium]
MDRLLEEDMNKSALNNLLICIMVICGIFSASSFVFGDSFDSLMVLEKYNENNSVKVKPSYEITVTSGANGQIAPASKTVNGGANATFSVKPSEGYLIDAITVDGKDIDLSLVKDLSKQYKYTFKKVSVAHTISATFKAIPTYSIVVTDTANGEITPPTKSFREGANATFTVKPSDGYKIAMITIDGKAVDLSKMKKLWSPHKYVFKKISAAHTISATFAPDVIISPPIALLKIGDEQVFTFTNSRGKKLTNITLSFDDQSIVTVMNGNTVTAKAEGTTNGFATFEGVEIVGPGTFFDPSQIKIVAPPQRPTELIYVSPEENETVHFDRYSCNKFTSACLGEPIRDWVVSAIFRFEGDDVLDSAQLFLDSVDITSDSKISTDTYPLAGGGKEVRSGIWHPIYDHTLIKGFHEVTVKGTSKAGKEVSYTWNFAKI